MYMYPIYVSYCTWQGCTLDFFTNNELHENDEARVSMGRYMSRRNGPHRPRGTSAPASAGATEQQPCTAPSHDSRGNRNNPDQREGNWTSGHVFVVREIVFETLAGLARDALKALPSARQLDSPNLHQRRQPSSDGGAESVRPNRTGSKPSPTALQGCGAAGKTAGQDFSSTSAGTGPSKGELSGGAAFLGAKRNADSDGGISGGGSGDDRGGGDGGSAGVDGNASAGDAAAVGAVSDAAADGGNVSAASSGAGAGLADSTGFCGNEGAAAGGGGLLLFNEQYVVKPPRSSIEFGWHTVRFDNNCSNSNRQRDQ